MNRRIGSLLRNWDMDGILACLVGGLLVFGVVLVAFGQTQKPDAPPVLTDTAKLHIRDAQLDQAQLVTQLTSTIDRYNALQAALAAQAKKLADLKAAALVDLKLDPEKWDVDMQKLTVIARPPKPVKPPASAAPAEPAAPPAGAE